LDKTSPHRDLATRWLPRKESSNLMPQPLTVRHSGHFLPILTALGALSLAACGTPAEEPASTTPGLGTTGPGSAGPTTVGPDVSGISGGRGMTVTPPPGLTGPTPGGAVMRGVGAPSGMGGASPGCAGGSGADDPLVRSTTRPSYAATVEPIFA